LDTKKSNEISIAIFVADFGAPGDLDLRRN
jgi:hypothetical protein